MSFPDRETVLAFLKENPDATSKQDIARGLKVKGRERQTLREILKDLEADGTLTRTGKRAWAQAEVPPSTCVVRFERTDENGDLIARAVGKEGPFGPDLIFDGYSGKARGRAPGVGDRGLARLKQSDGVWTARLMKLFEEREAERPISGVYVQTARGGRVKPASRKIKYELHVREADRNSAEDGDLVLVRPFPQRGYGTVRAEVLEVLGRREDPRAASLLAIAGHDIPTEFPQAVMAEAQTASPADVPRTDLTHTPLITIDPADARDHDDAVFAEALDDGFRVIVAIADVSAFVTPESALDQEAFKRGNSTYFPDRVVPMLPFELSADACSLKEGQDRQCLAVEMIFDNSGTKRKHKFMRAVMRSAGALSYEEAQRAINGQPTERAKALLDPVLKPLWQAYEALSIARSKRAPLDLDMPERKVEIATDGTVAGIRTKERFDAHKLIEELMIQANVCAAEELEKRKSPLLYRVHDAPSDAKIAALSEFLKTLDVKWAVGEKTQTHRFNRLLSDFDETDNAEAISEIVLRTQSQAIYSPENIGHFGLNLKKYAHFTSPIRRYSDLIVHRALISVHKFGPDGLTEKQAVQLDETAEHLIRTERRSMAAEREATDRYLAHFLADRVGAEFEGRITGVTASGLFIRLNETGADGFCPASRISQEYWGYNETSQALVGDTTGKRYELGQPVTVRLQEVTPLEGGLLLEILSDPRPRKPGEKLQKRTRGNRYDRGPRSGNVKRGKGRAGGKGKRRR